MTKFYQGFGCYSEVRNGIELIDRKVKAIVEGPYVEIQYIYTYRNNLEHLVATNLSFPQTENDIYNRVQVRLHNEERVRTIFEEIGTPDKRYDFETRDTGERFSYRRIQNANVRAHQTVQEIFTVIKPLKIILNKFYELNLRAFHISEVSKKSFDPEFNKWNIQLEIRSQRPFALLNNPIHHFEPQLSSHKDSEIMTYKAFYNVTVSTYSDFTVRFASEDFHSPQTIMATHPSNPHDHVFMFSVIPDLGFVSSRQIQELHETEISQYRESLLNLKKLAMNSALHYFQTEYLFVIDRSDSMKGKNIASLKKALNKILGILSKHQSYFNILSFGSTLELSGHVSSAKSPKDTTKTMKWVKTLEADLGEKDLLGTLKYVFEEYEWTSLPQNVIIFTDANRTDVSKMYRLIASNSDSKKICLVGIGVGASAHMIDIIGNAGGCPGQLTYEGHDFKENAFEILEATLFPVGFFDLTCEVKCYNKQGQVVYEEETKYQGIPRDKAFTKWINLKNVTDLESCKAKMFYSSQHRTDAFQEEIEIFRAQAAQLTDIWHKAANYSQIHGPQAKPNRTHTPDGNSEAQLRNNLASVARFSQAMAQEQELRLKKRQSEELEVKQDQIISNKSQEAVVIQGSQEGIVIIPPSFQSSSPDVDEGENFVLFMIVGAASLVVLVFFIRLVLMVE